MKVDYLCGTYCNPYLSRRDWPGRSSVHLASSTLHTHISPGLSLHSAQSARHLETEREREILKEVGRESETKNDRVVMKNRARERDKVGEEGLWEI